MNRTTWRTPVCMALALLCGVAHGVRAEEIWLADNTRVYGLVQRVEDGNKVAVFLPEGKERIIAMEDIVAIRFFGRDPLLTQAGTQELRFVGRGYLRGQILGHEGDKLQVDTPMAGTVFLDMSHLRGFVTQPMMGFASFRAEELVDSRDIPGLAYRDALVDRRGSEISGVVRGLERTALHMDIDDLLQVRSFNIMYLRGVRMADVARAKVEPWKGELRLALTGRDRSVLSGRLTNIRSREWAFQTDWMPEPLHIDLDEISLVQVLGGKVQYLSQIDPVKVEEQTILMPPQPYKMDFNCHGNVLSIAGQNYPWGIGVHADSALTFDLGGRYEQFKSDVGIDTRMGKRGSVVFEVLGDGKSLYKSPLVRGSDPRPLSVSVPVKGVKMLTLKVDSGGDLDIGDVANWGAARVLKFAAQ